MSWIELELSGVRQASSEGISALLFQLGAAGVQEDWLPGTAPAPRQPWDDGPPAPEPDRRILRAWFEAPNRAGILAKLSPKLDAGVALRWVDVVEQDWETSWQAGFEPIIVGDLTIAAPWHKIPGALIIEPGQGFGTGTHPTTRAMLEAVVDLAPHAKLALDVGCGSGILALAAARLGCTAYGMDNDLAAVADAKRQAEHNGLSHVRFDNAPIPELRGTYDLVLANLHAELLLRFADDLRRLSSDWLCMAGILADREPKVRAAYDPHFELVQRDVDGEWVALRYRVRR